MQQVETNPANLDGFRCSASLHGFGGLKWVWAFPSAVQVLFIQMRPEFKSSRAN